MSFTPITPLSKDDVAEILGVSIRTIENFVKNGRMPAPAHFGARPLWHPEIFYSWLDESLRNGGCRENGESVPIAPPTTTVGARSRASDGTKMSRPPKSLAAERMRATQARRLAMRPGE
jgi:phage terminase Nu1 subunit (DNA packaging protein)